MRETGYYWVKTGYGEDVWEVALYDDVLDSWKITGDEQDWFPEEINETRILNPDEQEYQDFQNKADNER